ncbi:MAG: response regulator [Nitrospirota bacterium]
MIKDKEALRRFSVLCVDDDEAIRNVMRLTLKRRFGEIYMAENGREGLELYMRYDPDMVITDNLMPVMDGVALIQKILQIRKEQPIILTKSFVDDERSRDCKVCANLIKPVDLDKLIETIFHCMGISSK